MRPKRFPARADGPRVINPNYQAHDDYRDGESPFSSTSDYDAALVEGYLEETRRLPYGQKPRKTKS